MCLDLEKPQGRAGVILIFRKRNLTRALFGVRSIVQQNTRGIAFVVVILIASHGPNERD